MKRILRIPRFQQNNNKPKVLELLIDEAKMNERGFPEEAKFLLVIDDGNNRIGFQLSQAEAALLYHRLGYALNETSKEYIALEEEARKNYEKRSTKSDDNEDISDEISDLE
ncbi:hypothetical protein SJAV_08990 [Sulfurisphaera javensis]|uniref:Uncharacterized protein n=1 Tax=Sulfurisphaera javensis TaxID=2049879 RepID=A0AAT9GQ39_9CREN